MTEVLGYSVVGLLAFQALWRAPAAWRGETRERSLWGACVGLTVSWFLRGDVGREVVGSLGVADLATYLKHVTVIVALCCLLRYVTAVDGESPAGRLTSPRVRIAATVHRAAAKASLGTVLIMGAVFFVVLHRDVGNSPYFMSRHAGEPALALYMGLFYLYLAAATAVCAFQWGSAAFRARRWALRVGLLMMATAMDVAVVYAVVRTAYGILTAVRPVSASFASAQETVTDSLLYMTFLLWCVGAIAPATQSAVDGWRTIRALVVLHPLWRELALTVPSVVVRAPSNVVPGRWFSDSLNRTLDLLRPRLSHMLLQRYVTEISDAQRYLGHWAPAGLYTSCEELAHQQGHRGQALRAVAEAYWIKAALTATAGGAAPSAAPRDMPPGVGDDFDAHVERLARVRHAFRHARTQTTADLATSTVARSPAHTKPAEGERP